MHGSSTDDWNHLANWMIDVIIYIPICIHPRTVPCDLRTCSPCQNELHDLSHNRWMVQQPRIFRSLLSKSRSPDQGKDKDKDKGPDPGPERGSSVNSFADVLFNFFEPLFAVTVDPLSNEKLHTLLQHMYTCT